MYTPNRREPEVAGNGYSRVAHCKRGREDGEESILIIITQRLLAVSTRE